MSRLLEFATEKQCACGKKKQSWEARCIRCQTAINEYTAYNKLKEYEKIKRGNRVYAVSVVGVADSPIKLGYTTNMDARLKMLQTGSPAELEILASDVGTRATELFLHHELVEDRLRLEWFRRSDRVLEVVEAMKAGDLLHWVTCIKQRR